MILKVGTWWQTRCVECGARAWEGEDIYHLAGCTNDGFGGAQPHSSAGLAVVVSFDREKALRVENAQW